VDVGGLEVAVDHVAGMGEGQPVADLLHESELGRRRPGLPAGDQLLEVAPLEELHGQVGAPAVLAEIEDGDDVGMVEAPRGLGFTLEPLAQLGDGPHRRGHRLQGDVATDNRVPSLEDLTHRPAADGSDDLVLPDLIGHPPTSPRGTGLETTLV
jgi:hypothetical protein